MSVNFLGDFMDDLHQLMLEHEEFLEEALEAMECGWPTQAQVDCIRAACGKPKRQQNNVLSGLFNEFGNIFGGKNV